MNKYFFKEFISSVNAKVPWYNFLGAAIVNIPVLFLGKSIKFYLALLSLQYFVVAIYIFIKFIKEKNWKFSIAQILICYIFFLSSGTLFGLAIKALLIIITVIILCVAMVFISEAAFNGRLLIYFLFILLAIGVLFKIFEPIKEKKEVKLLDEFIHSSVFFYA